MKKEKLAAASRLIEPSKLGRLVMFQTRKASLIFKGDDVFTEKNHIPCDKRKVQDFFDALVSLKVVRIIEAEQIERLGERHFFDDPTPHLKFIFENTTLGFVLGKKLNFNETFYMKIIEDKNERYAIVKDTSPITKIYLQEDVGRSNLPYLKFLEAANTADHFFYDTHIFQKKGGTDFHKASFSDYSLNFRQLRTLPPASEGTLYDEKAFQKFYNNLINLKGRELIVEYGKQLLGQKMGSLTLEDIKGDTVVLDLYNRYRDIKGNFLTSNMNPYLYEIMPNDATLFEKTIQDFWHNLKGIEK